MQLLVFRIVYPLLWLISKLPFPVFYKVSDAVFFLVYHIIGYRKKVVTENLQLVFPEKPSEEINRIRKKFYHHMCDMFLEMIKSISISNEELKRRFVFTNIEEIHRLRKMNKSIILMCGHYASYEWMNALQLYGINYRGFGIYKKVKNPYFDKLAKDIRGRYDGVLIPTVEATKTITANEKNGIRGVYGMVADQSPKIERAKYWMDFLSIKVPVYTGSEKLAKDLDMAVVYLQVKKLKRGFYEASFVTISDNPKEEPEFKITKTFFEHLEKQIKSSPQFYLWTHKRWKHRFLNTNNKAIVID
ncbi:lysophospholipid acyltransferase family protein [Antarcticibacterium sp. 1MA-6-2]|uniref:lysophospholipid acyltransferase family protein n=1 Tax=Antarcticibacterium sp. 1MA-6-2 TaxID=2908210 RepID=UPI001F222BFC|nr:lysophospholipid acyltransferase family protein [Antarcticibacterium sp. 1MA-6-2]UJH91271.1 lysophospholipid acyltransferase family protein [Antarcticibacterium sp. 1MA-6-2]